MSKNKMVTCFFVLICFSNISFAQSSNKVGVGIALFDVHQFIEVITSQGTSVSSTITLPIVTSPNFRIEPEVGFFRASDEEKNGETIEETTTSWRIGVGLFPQKTFDDFTLYYGGRVGYLSQSQSHEQPNFKSEQSASGFYIAPAIGGEHNFSDHFSLGGEAQLVYSSVTVKPDEGDWEESLSVLNTRALVFFRFYF
jgi:hypothetical protein